MNNDNNIGRLIPVPGHLHQTPMLFVADHKWWCNNQEEIETWMTANLPRGVQHLQGMVIAFDSEEDRMMFMLRFGL
jgi:hypothetical protein